MNRTFKLGINVIGGSSMTPDEHIVLLARIGWDGFFTDWHPALTEAYAKAAQKHGLLYSSIHAPFGGIRAMWEQSGTPEAHEAAIAELSNLLACLDDCAAHDVPVMVLHSIIGFEVQEPTEAGLCHFGTLIERANTLGVRLAFENVEGDAFLAAILNTYRGHPSVRFCLDTGHELCYNGGRDQLALYGDLLGYTHFNDNIGVTGREITWHDDLHLVMGDGVVDFPDVMRRIHKTGYEGILCCEMSLSNKPGKHTHDGYAAMPLEDFYRFCLERMRKATEA